MFFASSVMLCSFWAMSSLSRPKRATLYRRIVQQYSTINTTVVFFLKARPLPTDSTVVKFFLKARFPLHSLSSGRQMGCSSFPQARLAWTPSVLLLYHKGRYSSKVSMGGRCPSPGRKQATFLQIDFGRS